MKTIGKRLFAVFAAFIMIAVSTLCVANADFICVKDSSSTDSNESIFDSEDCVDVNISQDVAGEQNLSDTSDMTDEEIQQAIEAKLQEITAMESEQFEAEYGISYEEYSYAVTQLADTPLMMTTDENGEIIIDIAQSTDNGRTMWDSRQSGKYYYFYIDSWTWSTLVQYFSSNFLNMLADSYCSGELATIDGIKNVLTELAKEKSILFSLYYQYNDNLKNADELVKTAQTEFDNVQKELDDLNSKMNDAQTSVNTCTSDLNEANDELSKAKKDLEDAQNASCEALTALEEAETALKDADEADENYHALNKAYNDAQVAYADSLKAQSDAEDSYKEASERIAELEETIGAYQETIADLKSDIDEKNQEKIYVSQELADIKDHVRDLEETYSLYESIQKYKNDISELDEKIVSAQEQREELSSDLEVKNQKLSEEKENYETCLNAFNNGECSQEDLDEAYLHYVSAKDGADAVVIAIAALDAQLVSMGTQRTALVSSLADSENTMDKKIKGLVDDIKDDLTSEEKLKKALERAENAEKKYTAILKQKEDKLTEDINKLTEVENKISAEQNKLNEAKTALNDANDTLSEAKDRVKDMKTQLSAAEEKLKLAEKAQIKAQKALTKANSKLSDASAKLSSYCSDLDAAMKNRTTALQNYNDAQERLRNAGTDIDELTDDVKKCKAELDKADSKVKSVSKDVSKWNSKYQSALQKKNTASSKLKDADSKLEDAKNKVDAKKRDLSGAKSALKTAQSDQIDAKNKVKDVEKKIADIKEKEDYHGKRLNVAKSQYNVAKTAAKKTAATVAKNLFKAAVRALPVIGWILAILDVVLTILVTLVERNLSDNGYTGDMPNGIQISFQNRDSFRVFGCEIFYPIVPRNLDIRPQ